MFNGSMEKKNLGEFSLSQVQLSKNQFPTCSEHGTQDSANGFGCWFGPLWFMDSWDPSKKIRDGKNCNNPIRGPLQTTGKSFPKTKKTNHYLNYRVERSLEEQKHIETQVMAPLNETQVSMDL